MSILTNIPERDLVSHAAISPYQRKSLQDVKYEKKRKKKTSINAIKKEIRLLKKKMFSSLTEQYQEKVLKKLYKVFDPSVYNDVKRRPYGSELAQNLFVIEVICHYKEPESEQIGNLYIIRMKVYDLLSGYDQSKDKALLEQVILESEEFLRISEQIFK